MIYLRVPRSLPRLTRGLLFMRCTDGAAQGSLIVEVKSVPPVHVTVKPEWTDSLSVDFTDSLQNGPHVMGITVGQERHHEPRGGSPNRPLYEVKGAVWNGDDVDTKMMAKVKVLSSVKTAETGEEPLHLEVSCPRELDLDIMFENHACGEVRIASSMVGNTRVRVVRGSVRWEGGGKGDVIDLQAPQGSIRCDGMLEGAQVCLSARDGVSFQKIGAIHFEAESSGELRGQAVYATRADLESKGVLDVDTVHGTLYCKSETDLRVGGVTGASPSITAKERAYVHFDALHDAADMQMVSGNVAVASFAESLCKDDMSLTVAATQRSDSPALDNFEMLSDVSDEVDKRQKAMKALKDAKMFRSKGGAYEEEYCTYLGRPVAKNSDSKSADLKSDGIGKIRIGEASAQKLDAFFTDKKSSTVLPGAAAHLSVIANTVEIDVASWADRILDKNRK